MSLIPPTASLVKYDNPQLVSSNTDRRSKVVPHTLVGAKLPSPPLLHSLPLSCLTPFPFSLVFRCVLPRLVSMHQWLSWGVEAQYQVLQRAKCHQWNLRRTRKQRKSSTLFFPLVSGQRLVSCGCRVSPVLLPQD